MAKRMFKVTLEIEAATEENVLAMLDRTINDGRTLSFEITPEDEDRQVRVRYDNKTDSYVCEISTDGGNSWEFSSSYKCRAIKEAPEAEPEFIHFGVISQLHRAVDLGYRFVVR